MATMSAESTIEPRNGLKRRQSHTPEPETGAGNDNKRQRTTPGKNPPTQDIASRDDSTSDKKVEEAPTATKDHRASNTRDARRPSGVGDEKSKAKRLFGGLLGSLAQPGDRTTKRRQEIETRRKAELQQQDDARLEDKQRRAERLAEKRKQVKKGLDVRNMRLRHETILHQANFLQTNAGPKLFYRPWELRPEEEERIADQIRDAKAIVDRESGISEVRVPSPERDIESARERESHKDTETERSKDHELSDPTVLAVATKTASAHGSNGNGRAESAPDEEAGASATHTDFGSAPGLQQVEADPESIIKEAAPEKEGAEPDDEHMVEGDEDTVIY